MIIHQQIKEYIQLGYVKSIVIENQSHNYARLTLTTLEGEILKLDFSTQGITNLETSKNYESFESLLRHFSPKYIQKFNKDLMAKLCSLAKQQQEQQQQC